MGPGLHTLLPVAKSVVEDIHGLDDVAQSC